MLTLGFSSAKELLEPSDGSAPHIYKGQVTPFTKGLNHDESQALDRHEHMYILATMVSNLEEKLCISPSSKPLDGRMRLLHFGPVSSDRVMSILGRAFTGGSHVSDEAVTYKEIDGLRIDFDEKDSRWRRVCVDGKIVRVSRNGWVTVQLCSKSPLDLLVLLRAKS